MEKLLIIIGAGLLVSYPAALVALIWLGLLVTVIVRLSKFTLDAIDLLDRKKK